MVKTQPSNYTDTLLLPRTQVVLRYLSLSNVFVGCDDSVLRRPEGQPFSSLFPISLTMDFGKTTVQYQYVYAAESWKKIYFDQDGLCQSLLRMWCDQEI
jgi:hypothetical protein